MVLKLTKQQLDALYMVFVDCVLNQKIDLGSPEDLLLNMMLIKVFKKIRNLVEKPSILKSYGLNITTEEAVAYYAYFNGFSFGNYEATMIMNHKNLIHSTITNQIRNNGKFESNTTKILG